MDVLELLQNDHQVVSGLFDQIEASTAPDELEGLLSQLKYELETHADTEEQVFYSALRPRDDSGLIGSALDDHSLIRVLLQELVEALPDPQSGDLRERLLVLKENVLHHVEDEEGPIFDLARRVLTPDQLDELGRRLERAKGVTGAARREQAPEVTREEEEWEPAHPESVGGWSPAYAQH